MSFDSRIRLTSTFVDAAIPYQIQMEKNCRCYHETQLNNSSSTSVTYIGSEIFIIILFFENLTKKRNCCVSDPGIPRHYDIMIPLLLSLKERIHFAKMIEFALDDTLNKSLSDLLSMSLQSKFITDTSYLRALGVGLILCNVVHVAR